MNLQNVNTNGLRMALYVIAGGIFSVLGALNMISPQMVSTGTEVAGHGIAVLVSLLAAANVFRGKDTVNQPGQPAESVFTQPPVIVQQAPAPYGGGSLGGIPTDAIIGGVTDILESEATRWVNSQVDSAKHRLR